MERSEFVSNLNNNEYSTQVAHLALICMYCLEKGKPEYLVTEFAKWLVGPTVIFTGLLQSIFQEVLEYYKRKLTIISVYNSDGIIIYYT